MTTREDLELAILNAYNAGDANSVNILLRERRRLEEAESLKGTLKDLVMSVSGGVNDAVYTPLAMAGALLLGQDPRVAAEHARRITGAGYQPQTRVGGYVKNIATGAVPLPTKGVTLASSITGSLGGALAKFAEEHGYQDPISQIAAWMGPSVVHGGARALSTGAPFRDIKETLGAMTPRERAETTATLAEAQRLGVPMSVWQAAPEGSSLNVVGASVAQRPGATKMQEVIRAQTPYANQQWVRGQTERAFKEIADVPLDVEHLKTLAQAIRDVGKARHLDPASMKEVEKAVTLFVKQRPMTMDELVEEFEKVRKTAPPNSPELKRMQDLLIAVSSKQASPPLIYEPQIANIGEAISAKGRIKSAMDEFASMDQATRGEIRKAIDRVLTKISPEYGEAIKEYSKTKEIAEILAQSQSLKGKHLIRNPEKEGRLSPGASAAYAFATSPWWAAVPYFRDIASKNIIAKVDKALAQKDFKALEELAKKNPQLEGALIVLAQMVRGTGKAQDLNEEEAMRYLPVRK